MDDAHRSAHLDAIADAYPYPYWYDDVDEPESNPMLVRTETCDLCIVGGGYTGLWTAIIAKERDPSRDVVLLEGGAVGSAASGRNGGFMESSLTHGVGNGQERFPEEMPALERLGLENLNQIEAAIERYQIDCDYERTGVIDIAIDQPMVAELRADAEHLRALGQDVELLDEEAMQAEVRSPTYRGGLWRRDRAALVDPARLVWGLKAAAESLGVRIYEDTKATAIEHDGIGVMATTPLGRVRAGKVALGTNAFPPLLRRMKHFIAPVYDYALTTEPLTPEQLLQLRLCDTHLVAGIYEIEARTVELRLRGEQLELSGRAELVPLLLNAQVFLCGFERSLLDRNACLCEAQCAEVLGQLLLGEQLRVAQ
jgi:glycine/D-amino acid oxidase-like deaminating enzyme